MTAARVCADRNRHTCIEMSRHAGVVKYIPLDIAGMELLELSSVEFDDTYSLLNDYPVEKAAQLYAEYAAKLGGTKEAMQSLASIVPLSSQEIEMATTKKATTTAAKADATKAKATKAKATKAPVVKKETTKVAKTVGAKAPAAKKEATAKTPVVKKDAGEKKPSAANMFKDLIMAGKMTDDQIFAAVQKEFGLEDNKRSYVKWYRNDLTKKGSNPPAAKG